MLFYIARCLILIAPAAYVYYLLRQGGGVVNIDAYGYIISAQISVAFLLLVGIFMVIHFALNCFNILTVLPRTIKSYLLDKNQKKAIRGLVSFITNFSSSNAQLLPTLFKKISATKVISAQDLLILSGISSSEQLHISLSSLSMLRLTQDQQYWYLTKSAERLLVMRSITNVCEIADRAFAIYQTPYSADLKIRAFEAAENSQGLLEFMQSFRVRSLVAKSRRDAIIAKYR